MDKIYSRPRLIVPKISISIFHKKNNNRNLEIKTKFLKIIAIIIIATLTFFKILSAITPIFEKQCKNTAKSMATTIANEQATKVMSRYSYSDLCNISKDSNGNITMISSNVITINSIISDIPILIQKELEKEENNSFNLKLGAFTTSKFFSGVGPNIKIKVVPIGNVDTDLKSVFEDAGINQTLHRLYLQVECNVIILTPYKTIEEKITNQVLLAEAIIVGMTPNTYYNLEGMNTQNAVDVIE